MSLSTRPALRSIGWLALVLAVGCAREQPKPAPPRAGDATPSEVLLQPADAPPVRVKVEVARTSSEQQRGLMYRKEQLAPDRGMLFLFAEPKQQHFWMHNTYIPLDMIFIGADRRVVGSVENAQPLTDDSRSVEAISQFVLEVRAGFVQEHRVGPGTPVVFVGVDMDKEPRPE